MSVGDVIDWDEAMEQCGDDEEFLRELLADLRGEVDQQIIKVDEVLRTPTDLTFHNIMRASHVIKGAASNLMCAQLRNAAMELEQCASQAQDASTGNPGAAQAQLAVVSAKFNNLRVAVQNYHAFLASVGI
mmetsp:Transcript_112/g.194  ORF Transcript_112/g.194 Transcript_112/m.194 type:complete len:131 (-) Transcript_112:530-922(-)|eukprot:CAMPEP_0113534730 /NCGR_PEP_ID=MMETSP0015_2-20120614/5316_1 /TAXON_ID=2838 /ORGANISM="Odontella" /LENGTH=130 /DNA_ID=CAMNT_0000433913 /DNA_START=127 /DNA_END=519 /DNA_ORIENTATION=- /assembly_acc=CAM_ASM_000160